LELAKGCTVGAFEEAYAPREDRALGADVGPNRLDLEAHLQVVGGSIVAQVTQGEEVPQQDEQLACAHYGRDEPEHKRVEAETEVLHQGGVAWAEG